VTGISARRYIIPSYGILWYHSCGHIMSMPVSEYDQSAQIYTTVGHL
jgi:hypothetical protein